MSLRGENNLKDLRTSNLFHAIQDLALFYSFTKLKGFNGFDLIILAMFLYVYLLALDL